MVANAGDNAPIEKKFPIWIIIVVAVVFIAGIIGGITIARSAGSERRAAGQLELARKYVSEMNYEQAILAYEAAIRIDPKNADAYLELADLYLQKGDTAQVREVLDKAIKKVDKADRDRIDNKLAEVQTQKSSGTYIEGSTENAGDRSGEKQQGSAEAGYDSENDDPDVVLSQGDEYEPYWSNADNEVHEYNENGYVIKTTAYQLDGSVDHYIIYDCDDHGKLLSKTNYSGDGSYSYKTVFNADGIVIRIEDFSGNGSGHIVEYDDAGQLLKQTMYAEAGQVYQYYLYEQFENGDHIIASFKPDGSKEAYEKLDARGRSIIHIVYNDDGSEYIHWENEYFDNGNEKRTEYENGRIIRITEFDAAGNLVNSTEY